MRTAVLDLGGDALALVAAEPTAGGSFRELRRESVVLRLVRAIDRHGAVPVGLVELATETVRRLRASAVRSGVDRTVAVVRSDLARARNAGELIAAFAGAADAPLEALTVDDELTRLLEATHAELGRPDGPRLVVELTPDRLRLVASGTTGHRASLRAGSPSDLVSQLARLDLPTDATEIVLAGTHTRPVIRWVLEHGRGWVPDDPHGTPVSRGELLTGAARLAGLSPTGRLLHDGLDPAAADDTVCVARILCTLLERTPVDRIVASQSGLARALVVRALGLPRAAAAPDRSHELDQAVRDVRIPRAASGAAVWAATSG